MLNGSELKSPAGAMTSTLRTASVLGGASLEIAARSILESQVIGGTVASVVEDRALDHHWDGLFQHMTLRVGHERAAELLTQLEGELEKARVAPEAVSGAAVPAGAAITADAAVHDSATGAASRAEPRVHLYRRLRQLANDLPALSLDGNALWHEGDGAYPRKLAELRRTLARELSSAQLEIIELHFARRLQAPEVARVFEPALDVAEVHAAIERGFVIAQRVVGRRPDSRDRTLQGALLEAFALDPAFARAPRRRRRAPVLEKGAVIATRYEVEELLGAGAFADVYRARDRDVTDHVVALKILRKPADDSRSVHAALRELQLIASVFHPSVVQLKDHGWHEGHLWFVMPLYRGETLSQRVRRAPLTRRQAREIFEPLAEALATMHRAGVLHQDVKPDNVFLANLDPEGQETAREGASASPRILPVLLDLGVAAKDAELVLAGTPAYFAPEVAARFAGAADPAPVGPKADVFSLALTLRHALDPRPVEDVAGGSVDAFVAYRATRAPNAPTRRDLAGLRPCFERWLNFSPDARPSAEELRRELAALTLPQERAQRRLALMRWLLPTMVALLTLFGSVVYGLSREASLQRLEATAARERAEQARARAASASASLTVQQARRRELEADVARLEREYQNSRMTREQLASRLAQTEGELEVLSERQTQQAQRLRLQAEELRKQRDEHERALAELAATSAKRDELGMRLERANASLDAERQQRAALDTELGPLRKQLEVATLAADQARARVQKLEARWAVLRLVHPPSGLPESAPEPRREPRD